MGDFDSTPAEPVTVVVLRVFAVPQVIRRASQPLPPPSEQFGDPGLFKGFLFKADLLKLQYILATTYFVAIFMEKYLPRSQITPSMHDFSGLNVQLFTFQCGKGAWIEPRLGSDKAINELCSSQSSHLQGFVKDVFPKLVISQGVVNGQFRYALTQSIKPFLKNLSFCLHFIALPAHYISKDAKVWRSSILQVCLQISLNIQQ